MSLNSPGISRTIAVIAFFILSLFFFPAIEGTVHGFILDPIRLLRGAQNDRFASLSRPLAGEEILPERVRSMLHLLREAQIKRYRCSPALCADLEIRQRSAEGGYPIQPAVEADVILMTEREPIPRGCGIQGGQDGILLVHCP